MHYSLTWVDDSYIIDDKNEGTKDDLMMFFAICGFSKRVCHVGDGSFLPIQNFKIINGVCELCEWCLDFECQYNKTTWESFVREDNKRNPTITIRANINDPHGAFSLKRHPLNNINGKKQDYSRFIIDPYGDSAGREHVLISKKWSENRGNLPINFLEPQEKRVITYVGLMELTKSYWPIKIIKITTNTKNFLNAIDEILNENNTIFIFEKSNFVESMKEFYQECFMNQNGYMNAICYVGDVVEKNNQESRLIHSIFYGQISESLHNSIFGPNIERIVFEDGTLNSIDNPSNLFIFSLEKRFGQFALTRVYFWKDKKIAIEKYLKQCESEILERQKRID